jgi:hypothetical protein
MGLKGWISDRGPFLHFPDGENSHEPSSASKAFPQSPVYLLLLVLPYIAYFVFPDLAGAAAWLWRVLPFLDGRLTVLLRADYSSYLGYTATVLSVPIWSSVPFCLGLYHFRKAKISPRWTTRDGADLICTYLFFLTVWSAFTYFIFVYSPDDLLAVRRSWLFRWPFFPFFGFVTCFFAGIMAAVSVKLLELLLRSVVRKLSDRLSRSGRGG